jgi:hypothetical protein
MTSGDGIGDDYGELTTGNRMSDTARVKCRCRSSIQRKRGPCAAAWLIIKIRKRQQLHGRWTELSN